MDLERAKERILETENLTDNLEDDAANWLIDWGIAQLPALLADGDEETQAAKVHALMETMRQLNRIAPTVADGSPDTPDHALHEGVGKFAASYAEAFGKQIDIDQVAREIAGKSAQEAMQKLVEPSTTTAATAITGADTSTVQVIQESGSPTQSTEPTDSAGITSEPRQTLSAHLDTFAKSFSTQASEPKLREQTTQESDQSQHAVEPSELTDDSDECADNDYFDE